MKAKTLNSIPVFYTDLMVADSGGFSPSSAKPKAVTDSWGKLDIALDVHEPQAAALAELTLAHASHYVDDVLSLRRTNGFGNRSEAVARSLPYTSGAMLAAARAAIGNGRVAVATCSGFHHATYEAGGGFCTFNGLMVAALALLRESSVRRIGILDLDQHWGNGTQDIIDRLDVANEVIHYHPSMTPGIERHPDRFLSRLPQIVRQFAECDLVLYQAGADPHIDDPLGGWLTTDELKERDRLVFRTCSAKGIPVAWNLAGGYQRDAAGSIRPVLDIHDNTMRVCAEIHLRHCVHQAKARQSAHYASINPLSTGA